MYGAYRFSQGVSGSVRAHPPPTKRSRWWLASFGMGGVMLVVAARIGAAAAVVGVLWWIGALWAFHAEHVRRMALTEYGAKLLQIDRQVLEQGDNPFRIHSRCGAAWGVVDVSCSCARTGASPQSSSRSWSRRFTSSRNVYHSSSRPVRSAELLA